jgi:DNA-binding MarR family transcriptional regulator
MPRIGSGHRAPLQPNQSTALTQVELDAWRSFLRAHAGITRQLDADLIGAHCLTLNGYEVLLYLAQAPSRRLRMSELADRVLLTRSGVTRLVDGLERLGYVRRCACSADARGSFAELTTDGRQLLRAAAATHIAGVRRLFAERYATDELATLAALLRRLCGPGSDGC